MSEFPPGVWVEINSRCYPDYKFAEVVYHRTGGGYVVNLYKGDQKTQQTIVFDSEVISMAAMAGDGQSPSEILQEIMKRRNTNPSTSTNTPATVDPKVLTDAIKLLKKKLQSGKATVPGVNDGTQEDDCITPKQDDAIKRYDRAMKGIL